MDNDREIARLMYEARKAVSDFIRGVACPECGHKGPHDDNGLDGEDLSFCCTECGEQWDAIRS